MIEAYDSFAGGTETTLKKQRMLSPRTDGSKLGTSYGLTRMDFSGSLTARRSS
jgi:hypothetical protein